MRLAPTPKDSLIALFAQQPTKISNQDKTETKPSIDDQESTAAGGGSMPEPAARHQTPFAVKQDKPLGDLKQFYKRRLAAFRQVCPADNKNDDQD